MVTQLLLITHATQKLSATNKKNYSRVGGFHRLKSVQIEDETQRVRSWCVALASHYKCLLTAIFVLQPDKYYPAERQARTACTHHVYETKITGDPDRRDPNKINYVCLRTRKTYNYGWTYREDEPSEGRTASSGLSTKPSMWFMSR